MGFTKFELHTDLLAGVHDMGYQRPTPIQEKTIPVILEGRDVAGCAQTGTGKTAAYLLPIVHRLLPRPRGTTRCLILAPTRELAIQVDEQLAALAYHTPVRGAAVYGGVSMHLQENALRAGVDIVTATPGRLLDHLRFDYFTLKGIEILVLDEADRMLDMGFMPDLRRILSHLPEKRQNLLFSATLEDEVLRLAKETLHDPVRIEVGRVAPAAGITHAVYPVAQNLKTRLLLTLLRRTTVPSALLFTRTKERADRLARALRAERLGVALIHGGREQQERLDSLNAFRCGKVQLLVATDVASRGLDIEGISHVINYDVPRSPDDYIHRSGRTARVDAHGEAFTFVAPDEEKEMDAIERAVGRPLPRVMLPDFDYAAAGAREYGHHGHGRPRGGPVRRPGRGHAAHARSSGPPAHAPHGGAHPRALPADSRARPGGAHPHPPTGSSPAAGRQMRAGGGDAHPAGGEQPAAGEKRRRRRGRRGGRRRRGSQGHPPS
jgi:ATP-dependent RNA helicase RhlE